MHRNGCRCRNCRFLRSEPEELNVASGVVAMGRSGVVAASAAAEGRMPTLVVRKFPFMLSIILWSTYHRGSDAITTNSVSAGTSFMPSFGGRSPADRQKETKEI
jgi:hypothetical protein